MTPQHITYSALDKAMCDHNRQLKKMGKDARNSEGAITGIVVFKEGVLNDDNLLARSFRVASNNKAYIDGMCGYSVFAECLDNRCWGCYRIEHLLSDKYVEYCYLEEGVTE